MLFSFCPHHEDVFNKPPPDVRFERVVFDCRLFQQCSNFPMMNRLAYEGAIRVPIAVPWI